MYTVFYFIVVVTFFHKFKCRGHNLKANEIENDLRMIMKPIKKLSDVFPNHDIEVQFDIEQTRYHLSEPDSLMKSQKQVRLDDNTANLNGSGWTNIFERLDLSTRRYSSATPLPIQPKTGAYKDLPTHEIRRSNDKTNPDEQIVYMKDLRKAIHDLENKLLKNGPPNVNNITMLKKDIWRDLGSKQSKEKYFKQPVAKSEMPFSPKISLSNPSLLNILSALKKYAPLQKDSKPSDEDMSWLKIKLPV